jgi:AcrR family transcriptional regulator
MARPRSSGFDGQRELILSAAAQLFARRGYSGSTMAQVAAASGVSKATLYHYVRDKQDLLAQISTAHVQRLQQLVHDVTQQRLPPEEHLSQLVLRFMQAYESAQAEHRVLTEDVKFLPDLAAPGFVTHASSAASDAASPATPITSPRDQVLQGQRQVVQAVADAVAALRPDLRCQALHKPVAMLLFGMMNWTFTWLKASGPLSHQDVAQLLLGLFLGGLRTLPLQARAGGSTRPSGP